MSKKGDIKKAIQDSEKEIELLERKRGRSQSALLEAIITNMKPSEDDVKFFKVYTSLIEVERENLRKLRDELAKLR